MKLLVGIDIGGTKCAVSTGRLHEDGSITPLDKIKIPTQGTPEQILNTLCEHTATLCKDETIDAIGISCGGPLDSSRGLVLSPPNLPGWDGIAVTELFEKRFGVPAKLQNDADACALAEWKFGAGRGMQNIVFLTCGTGFGAGLILGGRLYTGACDGAGELGHVRLNEDGPVGYGKRGSFEGYCSGSGIAQMAATMTLEQLQMGKRVSFCPDASHLGEITAKTIADAARAGDELALSIWDVCGSRLGRALAVIVDFLNPDAIILGSVYARCEELLRPACLRVIEQECLPLNAAKCQILPAGLGEQIGDYAALAVASQLL